jgi:hypothetical protein
MGETGAHRLGALRITNECGVPGRPGAAIVRPRERIVRRELG